MLRQVSDPIKAMLTCDMRESRTKVIKIDGFSCEVGVQILWTCFRGRWSNQNRARRPGSRRARNRMQAQQEEPEDLSWTGGVGSPWLFDVVDETKWDRLPPMSRTLQDKYRQIAETRSPLTRTAAKDPHQEQRGPPMWKQKACTARMTLLLAAYDSYTKADTASGNGP